jgi:hypothetical protein
LNDNPVGLSPQLNPAEFGLFSPSLSRWLVGDKPLEFYQIQNNTILLFRKKIRPLRVHLMDDTIKTLLIDDSMIVSELTLIICQRVGISKPEEYALQSEYLNGFDADHRVAAHDNKQTGAAESNLARSPVAAEGIFFNKHIN